MTPRPLTNLFLSLTLVLGLTGCGSPQPPALSPGQSAPAPDTSASHVPVQIPFTLAYYPDYSIHPVLAENRANHALVPLLYEGLFAVDDTFQAVPVLCEGYTASPDGLTWTFTLRAGVLFSDGTPLTGQLAAAALKQATAPGTRYSSRIPGLRSISGTESEVVVTLNQPLGDLPVLLDIPIALDSDSVPPGTGAYRLVYRGDEPVLQARKDWWQASPLPFDTIRLSPIQQADDLIAAFDSGEVTLLDADLTGTNALGYSGSYEAWDYNTTTLLYLGFNTAKGYCTAPTVRQAISQAIDRESIATIPYARHAVAAALPFHPDSPLYLETLAQQVPYAPEVLAQTLDAAPPPDQPLKLVVNSENNAKVAAAEYIAYQLETTGLSVQVEKLPWDSFLSTLRTGSFDLYVGEVMLTADFDLSALLSSSGSLNYGRWKDSETDQLLSALRAAYGQQRPLCAGTLSAHLSDQVPIAPICFKNGSVLTQWGRLTGLVPRQSNIFFGLESWLLDP